MHISGVHLYNTGSLTVSNALAWPANEVSVLLMDAVISQPLVNGVRLFLCFFRWNPSFISSSSLDRWTFTWCEIFFGKRLYIILLSQTPSCPHSWQFSKVTTRGRSQKLMQPNCFVCTLSCWGPKRYKILVLISLLLKPRYAIWAALIAGTPGVLYWEAFALFAVVGVCEVGWGNPPAFRLCKGLSCFTLTLY